MAVEAPLSKFKRNNLILYIVICLGFGAWCAYDGYFNQQWIQDHTNQDGTAQTYLVFNKNAPYYLSAAAILFAVYLLAIKGRKIIADENELVINDKKKIQYDSIQKIDKTRFKDKGCFVITYNDTGGSETDCKISDKNYDNLQAVLDILIEKIS